MPPQKPLSPSTCRTSDVKRSESSTGRRSSRAWSFGSENQPSMGMPLAEKKSGAGDKLATDTGARGAGEDEDKERGGSVH